jgi:hypothetical protein
MVGSIDPLKFPEHFPPTDRWKKFFIGVRWLGPDLSFFESLKSQQASRSKESLSIWGGGRRQEIAETIASILQKRLRWSSNVFLPQDQFSVICHGPRFDQIDGFALEEAIEEIERTFGICIPRSFWSGLENATFGEVVERIANINAA